MTKYLSREEILAVDDQKYEDVAVPEWGGTIKVRGLTGAQRDDFEAKSVVGHGAKQRINTRNLRVRLIAACVIDPDTGLPLFQQADVIKLGEKSALALERVFGVCQRLSGLTDDDVKELEEGFVVAQNGSSTSV